MTLSIYWSFFQPIEKCLFGSIEIRSIDHFPYEGNIVRMRELYKIFVKTWIRFVSWSRILTPKRFDCALRNESGFISYRGSRILNVFKRFNLFSRIQRILTSPDESLVHRRTLNKPESIRILGFRFANPYWFQKICFADLFRRPVFERFVSWIRFVDLFLKDSFCGFILWKQKISNFSIRFVLEGFVYESRILKILSKIVPYYWWWAAWMNFTKCH